tara:strand:- start:62 stop:718 length:657 start_codon:yes stop_codon:yes gene_type:complete
MEMNHQDIRQAEYEHSGSSWTRNTTFDEKGYLVLNNLYDYKKLFCAPPEKTGRYEWWGTKLDQFNYYPEEGQVNGSIARFNHPHYILAHREIRHKLEKIIGRKLYNTYYYDRFYFADQELKIHVDRPACEISVSVHIGSNLQENWPFFIKSLDGDFNGLILQKGDGVLYKGCERPHWRHKMPGLAEEIYGHEKFYYHQIFFHYVLQDGIRAHYAYDRG